jgi:hypothetical protein
MTKQVIRVPTVLNDGAHRPVQEAVRRVNANFTELYDRTVSVSDTVSVSETYLLQQEDIRGNHFYVRPSGGSYGTEDGSSYANAFDGFANVVWASIKPGDTLFVAGKHSGTGIVINASGNARRSIKIRSCEIAWGASTDDPGVIWGGGIVATNVWTGPVNGVYSYSGGFNVTGALVVDEDLTVLIKTTDLATCEATTQSFYQTTGPTVTKYHPGAGGLKVLHYYIPLAPIDVNGKSYITIRGLTVYMESGVTGVIKVFKYGTDTVVPKGIFIDNCVIGFGIGYGIRSGGDGTELEVTNCTFFDCSSGIYHTNKQGGKLIVSDNEFYHTSSRVANSGVTVFWPVPGDQSAIAVQGGMDNLKVTDNYIHGWYGEGVNCYMSSTAGSKFPAAQILRNRIFLDTSETNVRTPMGVQLSGDNTADLGGGWAGAAVANNVITGCHVSTVNGGTFNGGVRAKIWDTTDPADRIKIYNNTFVDCYAALYGRTGGAGTFGLEFKNNIVASPEAGGYFINIENMPGTAVLVANYNIYSGTGNWKWEGGADITSLASWQSTSSQDANSITTNPSLGADYRISNGSAAENSGTDTGLLNDADGNPRPTVSYDIGAYEVQT